MVVNISKVLSGDWDYVRDDIRAVARRRPTPRGQQGEGHLRELLPQRRRRRSASARSAASSAPTGSRPRPATAPAGPRDEDLNLMRKHSPAHVQVKAAGGVRDLDRLLRVRALGVTRSGATARRRSWTRRSAGWQWRDVSSEGPAVPRSPGASLVYIAASERAERGAKER